MGIPGSELYGAVMCLPLVILVFLVLSIISITTCKSIVHQKHLILCDSFVSHQQVRCLYISMNVFFAMDVLQDVKL